MHFYMTTLISLISSCLYRPSPSSIALSLPQFLPERIQMEVNINLELSLPSSSSSQDSDHSHMVEEEYESTGKPQQLPQPQPQQRKLTVFYDGKMCVCDVTEIQGAVILMLAKKETEEKVRSRSESKQSSAILQSNDEVSRPSTGLMMKRSLQRFLQKRQNRIQEASPYYHQPSQSEWKR